MSDHKLVFIGGLHRSGTSILHECLREHPLASGFQNTGVPEDEGQHLQSVYLPAKAFGGPGKFGFHAGAYLTESSPLVSEVNRAKLWEEWGKHWDRSKPVLLEKSPPNLIRSRFLQALFPDAYFVMMIRHPIAVSYATQKWSDTSLYSLVRHWLVCHETLERDRPHLRRLLVLTYEDFVRDPDLCLGKVYSFLGMQPAPRTLKVEDANGKYFDRWDRLRRSRLGRYMAGLISWRFERRIQRFGYSLRDCEQPAVVAASPALEKTY